MNIKKFISLLTTLCFLVSFAGQNLSWAAPGASPGKIGAAEFKKIFESIPQIPTQYGKITAVSNKSSKSIIVNIQDLHCHPEAQKNISKIIEILDKSYKVRNIYVEGGYDKIDTDWLSSIEDKPFRDALIQQMIEDGRLNASEYYAVKNDKKDFLFGLEDKKRHEENIKRLGYILDQQQVYEDVLSRVMDNMNYWDAKYTNIRNKRFNRTVEKYRNNEIKAEKFYAILLKYVKKINENPQTYNNVLPIKLSNYRNIQNFLFATKANSELDMKKVQLQMQSLLAYLKSKLPPAAFQIFLDETDNFSDIDRLSAALSNFSALFDINLDINYKELNTFFNLQTVSRTINPLDLLDEERHLIERIRVSLSYDQTEIEISFLNDFAGYFREYLQNKLMANDFAYFDSRFDNFKELYSKYATVNDLKSIENDFDILNNYYRLNDKRNDIFVDNIFKYWNTYSKRMEAEVSSNPDDLFKNADEIIIVVTGGYHSHGLKELLAKKGITTIIITPTVTTEIENAELTYEELIRQQSEFLKEALAFTVASQSAQSQYEALVMAGMAFLKNMKYNAANIAELEKMLRSVVYESREKSGKSITVKEGENETTFRFPDGRSITIEKDESGLMSFKGMRSRVNDKNKNRPLKLNKDMPQLLEKVISYAPSMAGVSALTPYFDTLLIETIKFAEKRGLLNSILGKEASWDALAYFEQYNLSEIYGISLNTLAKLPKEIQDAFVRKHDEERKRAVSEQPRMPDKAQTIDLALQEPQQEADTPVRKKYFNGFMKAAAVILLALGLNASIAFTSIDHQTPFAAPRVQQTVIDQTPQTAVSGVIEQKTNPAHDNLISLKSFTLNEVIAGVREHGMLWLEGFDYSEAGNVRASLEASTTNEFERLLNAAYDRLEAAGATYEKRTPALLLEKYNNVSYAFASTDAGIIIIPGEPYKALNTDQKKINYLITKIAHEAVHIKNKDRVAAGEITRLEDEAEAFAATVTGVIITEPGNTGQIEAQQKVSDAYQYIINNKTRIMTHINAHEQDSSFRDLYYENVYLAGGYNEIFNDSISQDCAVISLYNSARNPNHNNAPYLYHFVINTKTGDLEKVKVLHNTPDSAGDYKYEDFDKDGRALELPGSAVQADKREPIGFKRLFLLILTAFTASSLAAFAAKHYRGIASAIKASKQIAYNLVTGKNRHDIKSTDDTDGSALLRQKRNIAQVSEQGELDKFSKFVFDKTVDNQLTLAAYYIFSDLAPSIDLEKYSDIFNTEMLKNELMPQKNEFLKTLSGMDRHTFNILEKALNPRYISGEASAEEINEAFNAVSEYIQSYTANLSEDNNTVNSVNDLLFLAAIEIIANYALNTKVSSDDKDLVYSSVIMSNLELTMGLFNQKNGLLLTIYLSKSSQFFLEMFSQREFIEAGISDRNVDSFVNAIKILDKDYRSNNSAQQILLNDIAGILNAVEHNDIYKLASIEKLLNTDILYAHDILNNNITNTGKMLESYIKSPVITSFLNDELERILASDVKLKSAFLSRIKNNLEQALQSRKSTLENRPDMRKADSYAKRYQIYMNIALTVIANNIKILRDYGGVVPVDEVNKVFSREEAEYLEIMINRNEHDFLMDTYTENQSLNLRLFALMYLKANAATDKDGNIDKFDTKAVREDFLQFIQKSIEEKKTGIDSTKKLKNDFYLRAYLTGMHLLLAQEADAFASGEYKDYLSKFGHYDNIFDKFADAVVLNKPADQKDDELIAAANADFLVDEENITPDVIAHELGHNYLFALAQNFKVSNKPRAMLHELFAFAVMSIVYELGIKNFNIFFPEDALDFDIYDVTKQVKVQEAHAAATGSLNILSASFEQTKNIMGYSGLISAIIAFAADTDNKKYQRNQRTLLKNFMDSYLDFIEKNYPEQISDKNTLLETFKALSTKDAILAFRKKQIDENKPTTDNPDGYGRNINAIEKAIAKDSAGKTKYLLPLLFSQSEIEYMNILRESELDQRQELKDIALNESADIKHRLYAAMLLRIKGNDENFGNLVNDFKNKFISREITVENNFDAKAVMTGMHLVLMSGRDENNLIPELKDFYKRIASSALIERGNSDNRNYSRNTYFISYSFIQLQNTLLNRYLKDMSDKKMVSVLSGQLRDMNEASVAQAITAKLNPANTWDIDFSDLFERDLFEEYEHGEEVYAFVMEQVKKRMDTLFGSTDLRNSLLSFSFTQNNKAGMENSFRIATIIMDAISESLENRGYSKYYTEMLTNTFVHGNNLDLGKKTYIYISKSGNEILAINQDTKQPASAEKLAAAGKVGIFGAGRGTSIVDKYLFARTSLSGTGLFIGSALTDPLKPDNRKALLDVDWKGREELQRKNYPTYALEQINNDEEITVIADTPDRSKKATFRIIYENGKYTFLNGNVPAKFIGEIRLVNENGKDYLQTTMRNLKFEKNKRMPETAVPANELPAMFGANNIEIDFSSILQDREILNAIPVESADSDKESRAFETASEKINKMLDPLISGKVKNTVFSFTLSNKNETSDEMKIKSLKAASIVFGFLADKLLNEIEKENYSMTDNEKERAVLTMIELLYNALVHGNSGDLTKNIQIFIDENLNDYFVINADTGEKASLASLALAAKAGLHDSGQGARRPYYRFSQTSANGNNLFISSSYISPQADSSREDILKTINSKSEWQEGKKLDRTLNISKIPQLNQGQQIEVSAEIRDQKVNFFIESINGNLRVKDIDLDSIDKSLFEIFSEAGENYITSPNRNLSFGKISASGITALKIKDPIAKTLNETIRPIDVMEIDFSKDFNFRTVQKEDINRIVKKAFDDKINKDGLGETLISISFTNMPIPSADADLDRYMQTANYFINAIRATFEKGLSQTDSYVKERPVDYINAAKIDKFQEDTFELLKNAFSHGNHFDLSKNIYIYIGREAGEIYFINEVSDGEIPQRIAAAAADKGLYGGGIGTKDADYSFIRAKLGGSEVFIANMMFDYPQYSKKDLVASNLNQKWQSQANLQRTLPVFEIQQLNPGEEIHVTAADDNNEIKAEFEIVNENGKVFLYSAKAVAGDFRISQNAGKYYLHSPYFKTSFSQKVKTGTRQPENFLESLNAKVKPDSVLELDLGKVFTDFKKPDYTNVDMRRQTDVAGTDFVATTEIQEYIKSLFLIKIGKNMEMVSLDNTVLSLDFGNTAIEGSNANYRLASNVLLLVAREIATNLTAYEHLKFLGNNKLDRDIYEILKNAFMHGNALDFSKKISIVINNEGLFILNEESGARPTLKQRADASWAGLYGRGVGILSTSNSSGYVFSRTELDGQKVFVALLGTDRGSVRTLKNINSGARWNNPEDIERTEYSYSVTQIPVLEKGAEVQVKADGNTFTIVNRDGRVFISDLDVDEFYAPGRDKKTLPQAEKLEVQQENGQLYLLSPYMYNIEFGKPYKSPLINEGIPQSDADFINKLALKNFREDFIGFAAFIRNIPRSILNFFSSIFFKSNAQQILVNYHFIQQSGIVTAVKEFGSAATLTEEGYVNLPVYVVNERPSNYAALNFENTGVSINENPLWVSKTKGAVIVYSDKASREALSQELVSNRKINTLIKQNAQSEIKSNMKNISIEWIEVDHFDADKAITYSDNGNIQVGHRLFTEMLQKGEMADFSASLRKIKNIDGYTLAQGILHNLDNINSREEFIEYLTQHQKIGNGQIIISPQLAQKIIDEIGIQKFAEFLNAARKDGVHVFLMTDSSEMPSRFANASFAGYVYKNEKSGKTELYNYALGTASQIKTVNITSQAALEEEIRKAGENVILNNSQLVEVFNLQKTGIAMSQIVDILSGFKILKMFTPQKMTPDFALSAARNFETSDMPEIDAEKINEIVNLYSAGNFDELIASLNLPQAHPISVYITKIKSQTQEADVYNSFVTGITEKILAADSLKKAHKAIGLQDKNYETILGKALILQVQLKTEGKGVSVNHNELARTMKEAEDKLFDTLQSLMPQAFDRKDPKAINAIAELIPAIAEERKKRLVRDDLKPDMDMKNYENILTAA